MWELSVKRIDAGKCEFTCHVRTRETDELWVFLARQGIHSTFSSPNVKP